jgi:hypothetical protein
MSSPNAAPTQRIVRLVGQVSIDLLVESIEQSAARLGPARATERTPPARQVQPHLRRALPANGDESVPTLVLGDVHLVNPSTRRVGAVAVQASGLPSSERRPWFRLSARAGEAA